MRHGGNVWTTERTPDQWLDFSANLRPEGPPDWVMQTMTRALRDTRYYPDRTQHAVRCGLAEHLGVEASCVLPTAGGAAAIDAALSLHTGAVYLSAPTFGEYAERAKAHGRQVLAWEGHCRAGDTVVLCNPNNPTGYAHTRDEVLALHAQIEAMGGTLIVDEAFIHFCADCSVFASPSSDFSLPDSLMVVGSLTKVLGVPGIRLGYLCASPSVLGTLHPLPWSLNTLACAIASELPAHGDQLLQDARINALRREALADALRALGAEVFPSKSNFLLVDFHRDMTKAVQGLRQQGILVRTCASFGLPASIWRLAVKTESDHATLLNHLAPLLSDF